MSGTTGAGRGRPLTVTIVNHDSRDELARCLASLLAHPYTLGPMEIVVLDNCSSDGSLEMLRAHYPDVVVVAENRRRGFGANQNRAVAAATGQVLFLLNPDAEVHSHTIDRLVAALDADRQIIAAGGPVYNGDGSYRQARPLAARTPSGRLATALGWQRTRSEAPWSDTTFADGWLSGGGFLIERAVFEEVGGFDEAFFMYAEDADLFTRLAQRGYRFAWVGDAGLTHPLPPDPGVYAERRAVELVRSELRYAQKHFGPAGRLVYRSALLLESSLRLAVLSLPGGSRVVRLHGMDRAYHRRMHRARLRAVLSPFRQPGLSELAAEAGVRT